MKLNHPTIPDLTIEQIEEDLAQELFSTTVPNIIDNKARRDLIHCLIDKIKELSSEEHNKQIIDAYKQRLKDATESTSDFWIFENYIDETD